MTQLLLVLAAALGLVPAAGVTTTVARPAHVAASPHDLARASYRAMTPRQRVGQLFMTGLAATGPSDAALTRGRHRAIGNVILTGDTSAPRSAVAQITRRIHAGMTVAKVAPLVSTDQEGGEVQRLSGSGFATIPSALSQGQMQPAALRAASRRWGRQLAEAGIDLDLAPDADTVPSHDAEANQPIGRYDREYGHHPKPVERHVVAFVRGMRAASTAVTVKHFPGLGRATGNTDVQRHVTDPTTRHDAYLRPFRGAVKAHAQAVMVSSAVYPHIDGKRPACFSRPIITGMLRRDLGFRGVVISDDLAAAALAHVPAGRRAVRFFGAGGTMALDTVPKQLPVMIRAVAKARSRDPRFASQVRHAVITDLATKARAGLVHRGSPAR